MLAKNFLEKFFSSKNNKFKIKYAIFDFDNTIYPGLLLYDLANDSTNKLKKKTKKEKKLLLGRANKYFKKKDFPKSLKYFLKFLKDQSVEEFYAPISKKLNKIPKNFKKILKILHKKNIKCYLVSLTSDIIARQVSKKFNFHGFLGISFGVYNKSNKLFFNGKIKTKINQPQLFKFNAFKKFKIKKPILNCVCFGDSLDDLLILKNSAQSFVIGKNKNLIKELNNRCLILSKNWSKIQNIN